MTETRTEQHKVTGEKLLERIKALVREGNVRRITIKNEEGQSLLEIPLTVGVVGAVLMPVWVAIGAIAALAANYTLEVEKIEKLKAGTEGER
ncbi:MAG: DUF4342 domain-containing protein [Gemmatimonadales bacterium]